MKHNIFPLSIIILIYLLLISCSDAEIHSSEIPELTQSIFVIPENDHEEPYIRHRSSDVFYVNLNEKNRICGVYSLNGKYLSTDKAIPYYISHKWNIDNNESGASSVYYSFDKVGQHKISFETIDHLGDTLLSYATIYVSTPSAISLQTPANHYNQVDGKNKEGLEISWRISGIDPWETASCYFYATYNKDSVWKTPLGEVDCYEGVNLIGELDLYVNEKNDSIDHKTESSTIYWGIQATIKNEKKISEIVYSEIYDFSTKLHNDGNAIVEVPVTCMNDLYPEKSLLNGAFISATGDTLSKISKVKANSVIRQELSPQSNIKVIVCDSIRTEFGCDSTTFDVAPSTKTITDTIFLKDNVKPNIIPVKTNLPTTSPIEFFILDNGTGVNTSKIQAFMNSDSIKTTFQDYTLSFLNSCTKECNLVINAEDYARNKLPDVYWKIKVNGSETKITGPFSRLEGNE